MLCRDCFFLLLLIMQLQLKSYKLEILTELRTLTTKTFWLVLLSGFYQIYLANHPNRIAKNERFFLPEDVCGQLSDFC